MHNSSDPLDSPFLKEPSPHDWEARYLVLFNNVLHGIVFLDGDGVITSANPAAERILGLSLEQLQGRTAIDPRWQAIHEDGSPFPGETHPSSVALRTGQPVENAVMGIFNVDRATTRWIHVSAVPLFRLGEPKPHQVMASFVDITERKQAQDASREAEWKFRALFEKGPIGVAYHQVLYDEADHPCDYFFLDANEKYMELTGVDPRGRTVTQAFPGIEKDPFDWIGTFARVARTGESIRFEQYLHLNNRWYDCVAYQYKPDHFVAAFLDITDRKQIEEGLNQSEQKFRTLFENLAEGVALHELVWDDQGAVVNFRILAVNPAYQRHTGLDAASAPGRLGTEIYGTEVPPYLEEFSKVALGGEPYAFDTYFPPLEKHFRISVISPRHGQFATVFEDITERKHREEELKQKNAEMERFTYMISHDLKSPLVTVRTFLGYLEQDLTQGKQERVTTDMGFIRDATEKMGRLLEDLLEVSRVGRVVNPPVRVSLADLIQGALAAVAGALASQKVAVHVNAPHLVLVGDRPRLEEIWQNLLENAAKYMGEQPQPTIQLGAEMQGEDTIFFVKDNGMGIDPRFHAKIFGLFEKLDAGSEGTGLGLALVKRIVEFHEGQIWVESEGQGQGTCFRFTLPLALKARAAEL